MSHSAVPHMTEPTRAASAVDRLAALTEDGMRRVDSLIHDRLSSRADVIPEIGAHIVDAGGKRLRPMLTLAGAGMFHPRGDAPFKLAAAVEFIHTATLLHDDVVDESEQRRGMSSANVIWGNQASVLVGDYLFSRAFELMVEAQDLKILDILSRTASTIAEGEVMQLSAQRNLETTEAQYMQIIRAKTAALFAAAAECGGLAAGCDANEARALRRFGEQVGIAFQLVDDALDYAGVEGVLGKSVGDDFREGKMTLPLIRAIERADDQGRAFWRRTVGDADYRDGDLDQALSMIAGAGSADDARRAAEASAQDAANALEALPAGPLRDALRDVTAFTVSRSY